MAIRLNLLAEAQAAEELRRKDPVKRVGFAAALLVALMLVWSSSLQLKAKVINGKIAHVDAQMGTISNEFRVALDNQKKADDARRSVAALRQLSNNRFLGANLLNALQQTTVDDIELLRLKVSQDYIPTEEVKPRTTEDKRTIPGKPATVTERIMVTLEGRDSSSSPGDQVGIYKNSISNNAYFRSLLGKTNGVTLKNLSAPELVAVPGSAAGRPCVLFTLECRFPDKTR
jgi:hypothetical protein